MRRPVLVAAAVIAVAAAAGWVLTAQRAPSAVAPPASPSTASTASTDAVISPTGAAITDPATPKASSTTSTAPAPPAVLAARIAVAYLSAPPDRRRAACRPFDTDNLDAVLAAPTWAGAATTTAAAGGAVAVTVSTPVAADVTPAAIGYELTANLAGQATPVAVQVRMVQVGGGRWLADSLNAS